MRRKIFYCFQPLPSDIGARYQTAAETSPANIAEAVDVRSGSYFGRRNTAECLSLIVCETSTTRRPPGPNLACCATKKHVEDLIASHTVRSNLQV